MRGARTLFAKFRSFVREKVSLVRNGGDAELARSKIAKKNQRLRRLQERVEKKDRELDALWAELTEARSARRFPSFQETSTPVFFIVGNARSGTTWLANMLNAHHEILCMGEGRFFERDFAQAVEDERVSPIQPTSLYGALSVSEPLATWISRSVWTMGEDVDQHLDNLTRLAINYFLTERLSKTGKRIVGDKTPFRSAEVVSEISRIYPEARVIHAIRDGRDVAVSVIHHLWRHSKSEGGIFDLGPEVLKKRDAYREGLLVPLDESLFTEEMLAGFAASWSNEVGKAVEDGPALLGDNYTEVRYEDLLGKLRDELDRLLGFLGADSCEETVRRCIKASSFEKKSGGRRTGEEEPSSFYRKGVAGDWKNVFTERDKQIFKEFAGDLLISLGYEKDNDW